MPVVPFQTLRESDGKDWSYGPGYVEGSLRLFRVDDLLLTAPESAAVVLSEWRGIDQSNKNDAFPKYAAISHSWLLSPETKRLSSEANRPLNISLGDSAIHTISWHGLYQAARAAQHLQCDYMWLDLLCLHQGSAKDKKLQIQKMGHIYENAEAVIVMPGGVAAAQSLEEDAPWITRAWTLQEATLCAKTYVLVLYPAQDPRYHYILSCTWPQTRYDVKNIEGDLALSELKALICSLSGLSIEKVDKTTGEHISRKQFEPKCLGHNNPNTTALRGLLAASCPEMRQSAAWRSVWLRTSTRPQDMVFSVMHLFGVQIEVDYTRTHEDLIIELARKTASLPAWLDIGAALPFDPRCGLVPAVPLFRPNDSMVYSVNDELVPTAKFSSHDNYIADYDVRIRTPVTTFYEGDLVCAVILEILHGPSGKPYLSDSHGNIHDGFYEPVKGSHVMVLGDKTMYFNMPMVFPGSFSCQLEKSKTGIWERVGTALYVPGWIVKDAKRSHLRIGGPPGAEITPCDCDRNAI